MIYLEEGLTLCGRCCWGMEVGFIIWVGDRTYRVRWLDGHETEMLRPDVELEDVDMFSEAAE